MQLIRLHRAFLITATLSVLVFSWFITDGTFRFFSPESFSSFYDYQARSLLQGRLDVPGEAIAGEAFVFRGKTYGYFGPTPALMRLPLQLFRLEVGRTSRAMMTLDFALALVAAYGILIRVSRWGGTAARPGGAATVLLIGNIGLGSTLLFLGGRAYVYHEAILCSAAWALVSCYFALVYEERSRVSPLVFALLAGALAVNARPCSGLFALGFLAVLALGKALRRDGGVWRRHVACILGCGAAVGSFNAISYLKFRSPEGMPLKYNVQYDAGRLSRMGGSPVSIHNFTFNLVGYFVAPTVELKKRFPFIFYVGRDPANYVGYLNGVRFMHQPPWVVESLRMDMSEPMAGIPYAMTGLLACALAGYAVAIWSLPRLRRLIWAVTVAAIPSSAILLLAAAESERYTADFCLPLILAAAIGLVGIEANSKLAPARYVIGVLMGWSIAANLAITMHFQGREVWGVPDFVHQRYNAIESRVDRILK